MAARLLGLRNLAHPTQVWIGGHWVTVIGILGPVPLQTPLDSMAFIGFPVAEKYFAFDGHPTGLFVRTVNDPTQVNAVYNVLPATANPANPSEVTVNEPADALQAEIATAGAYSSLFLALGAVALLVGGVGIANVMIIAVLERRSEIGLRRALGATRRHVAGQFLTDALLLSLIGGLAGTATGVAATVVYAFPQHWPVQIPPLAMYGEPGPPWPSAPSPASTPPPGPPASHQPKHYAPHDHPARHSPAGAPLPSSGSSSPYSSAGRGAQEGPHSPPSTGRCPAVAPTTCATRRYRCG